MTSQIAVLVNPTAGRGRHRQAVQAALRRLESAGPVKVIEADGPAQAEAQARAHVESGAQALVAIGGDGTVHLALQAVAGTGVPLGIVAAGTGNDMATCFGLPTAAAAAADTIANALADKRTQAIDLARLTTVDGTVRWFGGVLAAGFDAIVNERGNSMRWPKGPRRYDLAIMVELARLRPRHYRAVFDGQAREFDAVLLAIGNCTSYGGGMRIAPEADHTDGLLDIVWAEPISRATLVRIKPRVYEGTHVRHPKVKQLRATEIELDAPGIVCYADGERIAPLPVKISSVAGALTLLG